MTRVASRPIAVLCPMQIERSHLQRQVHRLMPDAERVLIVQTGIGKEAVLDSADRACRQGAATLILAGACGGLSRVDDVPPIARIIDEHGNAWTPTFHDPQGVTLVAVDRIIATPGDKSALARATGASIVDMESHAFGEFCERRRLSWAVVRGVSDTPDQTLPHEVLDWISPSGDTRNFKAAADLLRKPSLIPHIMAVIRRSNRVLPKVGERVVDLVRRSTNGQAIGLMTSAGSEVRV